PSMTIRREALSVTNEAMIQVIKINTIVPLRTFSSIISRSYPTIIMAKVAAAWALLKPKIKFLSFLEYFAKKLVAVAAKNLPVTATTVNVPAIISAIGPFIKTLISTIIPTDIKKKGMKMAFPMNSIRFIKAEECGMSLLSAKPATNAPIIG